MKLEKILEKKGLEARESDNTLLENYKKDLIEFKEYFIQKQEYRVLEDIASEMGVGMEAYEEGLEEYSKGVTVHVGKNFKKYLRVDIEDDHITGLEINNYPLKRLPEAIDNLSFLKKLYLKHTSLTSLPSSIGSLKQLETLDLDQNNLDYLPETMKDLKSLKNLSLINKRFSFAEYRRTKKLSKKLRKKGVDMFWICLDYPKK